MRQLTESCDMFFTVLLFICTLQVKSIWAVQQAQVDLTLEPGTTGRDVVDATLNKIRSSNIFSNDYMFPRRLAYVATQDGTSMTKQNGGIWKIDMKTYQQTKSKHANLHVVRRQIQTKLSINWTATSWVDLDKPFYSGLAARMTLTHALDQISTRELPRNIQRQAHFYANHFLQVGNKTQIISKFIKMVKQMNTLESCTLMKADLVFLIDNSGSMNRNNDFKQVKKFVMKIIDSFPVAEDQVRVGIILFNEKAVVSASLGDFKNKQQLGDILRTTQLKQNAKTNIAKALEKMTKMFVDHRRETSMKIAVIITDGDTEEVKRTLSAAQTAQDAGISLITVGKSTQATLLKKIASSPAQAYLVEDINNIQNLEHQLRDSLCKQVSRINKSQCTEVQRIKGMTNSRSPVFYEVAIQRQNLTTVVLKVNKTIDMYAAYNFNNPNSAIYDFKSINNHLKIPKINEEEGNCTKLYIGLRGGKNIYEFEVRIYPREINNAGEITVSMMTSFLSLLAAIVLNQ